MLAPLACMPCTEGRPPRAGVHAVHGMGVEKQEHPHAAQKVFCQKALQAGRDLTPAQLVWAALLLRWSFCSQHTGGGHQRMCR